MLANLGPQVSKRLSQPAVTRNVSPARDRLRGALPELEDGRLPTPSMRLHLMGPARIVAARPAQQAVTEPVLREAVEAGGEDHPLAFERGDGTHAAERRPVERHAAGRIAEPRPAHMREDAPALLLHGVRRTAQLGREGAVTAAHLADRADAHEPSAAPGPPS